jgi:hypothetical protein
VKKLTYGETLLELRTACAEKHKRRGRHSKLSPEDILFMVLKYWRQYVTQKVFKITANKYRNHRKRFSLRMSLICGIINFGNRN